MAEDRYRRIGRRPLSRRRFVGGASLAGTGLAGWALAGCSSSNNKKATPPATQAATRPPVASSAATSAPPSAGTAVATRAGTAAPAGSPVAAAPTVVIGPPDGQTLSKLTSEKDFFAQVPDMPPKDFNDADIKTGGSFNRLFDREPALDFHATTLAGPVSELIMSVYSRFLRMSCAAGVRSTADIVLEGDLASKWERPDPLTLLLTLNANIKWQNVAPLNGRAFTVDDIKYSFDRGATFNQSAYKTFYQQFAAVEDAGNGQVRLKLAEPNPAAEPLLAAFYMNIMPPEIGQNADTAQRTAVGTGGFILDHHTPNVEYAYRKNPDFFKKDAQGRQKPYMDGYRDLVVQDPATRLAMFEKGDVDHAYAIDQPLNQDNVFDFVKRNPNFVYQAYFTPYCPYSLVGHSNQAPWSDVRVRQAISLLIDRPTVINQLLKGQAYVGPYFPWNGALDKAPALDELGQWYKYDPARAKQLLAAAGFANGLELDLNWYQATIPEDELVLIQQQAAAGGVKYNLVKSADTTVHAQKQTTKSWNGLIMVARGLNFADPMATLPVYLPGSGTNNGDVNDPKLVDLYNKQKALLGAERRAALKQVWDYLLDQVYEVALPNPESFTAWRPWLKNWRDMSWSAGTSGGGQWDSVWIGPKS